MQKGGIVIKREYEDYNAAFAFFLENCTCTMLSNKSRGGLLLKLIFTGDPVGSPFLSFTSNNILNPITEVIIKLCFISDKKRSYYFPFVQDGKLVTSLNDVNQANFNSEIQTQIDIYKRSLDECLEPICPSIITYKTIRDNTDKIDFITTLLSKVPDTETNSNDRYAKLYLQEIINQQKIALENEEESTENIRMLEEEIEEENYTLETIMSSETKTDDTLKETRTEGDIKEELRKLKEELLKAKRLEHYYKCINLDNFSLGYIVMECLTGFTTVYDKSKTLTPIGDKFVRELVIFELYRLYQLGYLHGDVNPCNFMVNLKYLYVTGFKGRVIIIDFGSTFKVTKQMIPPTSIMDVIELSKTTPIPQYSTPEFIRDKFNQQTFGGWMWLWDTLAERDMYNNGLEKILEGREKMKNTFREYLRRSSMGSSIDLELYFVNKNAGTESVGGSLDVIRNTETFKPELSLPFSKLSIEKDKLIVNNDQSKIKKDVNTFDALDPDHKLNEKNISNYIKYENEYADNLLKKINEPISSDVKSVPSLEKGGLKKHKINKKTIKNKKSKRK